MKHVFRSIVLASALLTGSMALMAQEVNTLYFLENAPMRSQFNPALMPVSNGYVIFSPLGYSSLWVGNNALTMSDVFYQDKATGKTLTPLNQGEMDKFLNKLHTNNLFNLDMTTTILGFGARTKKGGYFHGGIFLRADMGLNLPKSLFNALTVKQDPNDPKSGSNIGIDLTNGMNISGLGYNAQAYLEIGGGYTRPLNDQWTIGGKIKLLLGLVNANVNFTKTSLTPGYNAGTDAATAKYPDKYDIAVQGNLNISMPGAIDPAGILPTGSEGMFDNIDQRLSNMFAPYTAANPNIGQLMKPAGYGAAIDFGFTYKPIKYVQIAAAINDLGFICWTNGLNATIDGNATFDGLGTIQYSNNTQAMQDQMNQKMEEFTNALGQAVKPTGYTKGNYVRMSRARLNVSVDGLFWENRVGVGILSQTKLYNNKVYEELTIGGFFRPVNWFNLAASYSIINGHGGTLGAALGFAPYDGIMLTLATDYIPCYYADLNKFTNNTSQTAQTPQYYLPYKSPGVNVALGFAIVWGTNKKRDSDKDGIRDDFDMCPRTPRNVRVDAFGCPIDTDGDGVPDYIDECPNTPAEAFGMVDASGCALDGDLDEVPDYKDLCPNTPEEARGSVDENGCTRDTDGDGVPDYRDDCPNTVPEAVGHVDEHGCDKDSDGDGVPDYLDKCPNTPEEAYNFLNEDGCPLDMDEDGVPDYLDKCPRTVYAARQYVDSCGCDKDSDKDGIPDYLDECPYVPGVKENKGCPQIKRAVTTLLKKAMSGIQFETGKSTILKKSYPILDEIAKVFIDNPSYIIEVQGHTDNVGNAEANMNLSDRRAQSVRDYLVKKGVDASRMTAHGYGSTMPIDDNKTKAGRAKNRRVEFKITFEQINYEIINDHNPDAVQPADSTAVAPAQ